MSWLRRVVFHLQAALAKRSKDAALDGELQTHLEQNIERGMSPKRACRKDKLPLGGTDQIKESLRDQHGLPLLVHFDEMTALAYLDSQLDQDHAWEIAAHATECNLCRELLQALDHEGAWLRWSLAADDEERCWHG
jgi:hypothetical protein